MLAAFSDCFFLCTFCFLPATNVLHSLFYVLAQLVQLVILSIYARGLFFYLLLIFKFFHDLFEPISTGSFCNLESLLLVSIKIAGNSSPCCTSVTLLFGIWFYTCDLVEQAQFMLLFPDKQLSFPEKMKNENEKSTI